MNPILIIEDEKKIAELLRDYLRDSGFETHMIHNGDEALQWLNDNKSGENKPRLVLLDLMLPGMDGLSICREFRKFSNTPVIMVTAKSEEIDRLLGLEIGADDYICKPFSPREVIARVKAVLRRFENQAPADSNLTLDEAGYKITLNDTHIELTAIEFKLFKTMHDHPGHIYSRDQLSSHIYDDHRVVSDRTIDSHIKKLRQKISSLGISHEIIHSVYGVGYKFE
jgi:two-component system response regulator BaeR